MLTVRAGRREWRCRPIMLSPSSNSLKKPLSSASSGSSGMSSNAGAEEVPSSSLTSLHARLTVGSFELYALLCSLKDDDGGGHDHALQLEVM